jgi:hypothetical protein
MGQIIQQIVRLAAQIKWICALRQNSRGEIVGMYLGRPEEIHLKGEHEVLH